MHEYPKIETLYNRDPLNMKRVLVGELRDPAFGLVDRWLVTEKIDGTNVRVMLDPGGGVRFGGRTDKAQMPTFLLESLQATFPPGRADIVFDEGTTAILYGEGYGPRIQKGGGDYAAEAGFILFDVAVLTPTRTWWLDWEDVCDVARKFGIQTVPVLGHGMPTAEAVARVEDASTVAAHNGVTRQQEGIVCRTDPLLLTRSGSRLVWKLKARDLA